MQKLILFSGMFEMKKIAILYICTGRYSIFWKGFFESCEKLLLNNTEKHYYVFTDCNNLGPLNERVHLVHQSKLGWPYDTLMRFSMFLKVESSLKKYDYVYFFNANLKIVNKINESEFLPVNENELVVVQHPGYFDKYPDSFTYDRNPLSLAYIPLNKGDFYVAGGLNGGTSKTYLNFIRRVNKNTQIDFSKGVVAKWHDESHLNKYILGKKIKLLHAGFLYPEFDKLDFSKKIIIRDKNCFGGHNWLRSSKVSLRLVFDRFYCIVKYYFKKLVLSVGCFFGKS